MSINSLFSKKTQGKASLSIVLLKDGVHICQQSDVESSIFLSLKENWQSTLSQALEELNLSNQTAVITLGSSFYQTYQIDKPVIPEEDWPEALPFLVKDLITERVNEVIVSGVSLSHVAKVQAYVMKKSLLEELQTIFSVHNIEMSQILPEDAVWSKTRANEKAFMLLHSSGQGDYKMGAFFDGNSIFQRIVRGMRSPITGESKDEFHLDNLALEIQRSMDFLSSQLKQTQINRLFVCSDSDDLSELSSELMERLNVKVNPLVDGEVKLQSGALLAKTALNLTILSANFYGDHLKPKKERFGIKFIFIAWLITAAILCLIYLFLSFQNSKLAKESDALSSELQQTQNSVSEMQQKLDQRVPSEQKLMQIERIKDYLKTQQKTLKAVEHFDDKALSGYSEIMSNLAMLKGDNISLTHIKVNEQYINFEGFTRSAQDVPIWVQQFKDYDSLKNRLFKGMSITRDEDDNLIFSLHSIVGDDN